MTTKKDSKGRNLKQNEDQMKDGRYRYRYTDKLGNRHAIYAWRLVTTDKTPAGKKHDLCLREKIMVLERDSADGIDTYAAQSSVNELIGQYLDLKVKLAVTTKNNYIHMWKKNIKDSFLGRMRICDVKKTDIQRFYADLYENKHFSVQTIQLYQNLLFPTFQQAVDDNVLRTNPCRNCMKDYAVGSMSSTRNALTGAEQDALLQFAKDSIRYRDYFPLLSFLLGTGCRISEALGMTWDDIHLDEKYVEVNHQIIYSKKNGKIVYFAAPPKTKKTRKIPICEELVEILRVYKEATYLYSISSDFEVDGYQNFVFCNSKGKLKTPHTLNRTFHLLKDAYNKQEEADAFEEEREPVWLPTFSAHILRHTFCTRMAEKGMDVKVLQEIMGHANIAVTMQVYNHAEFERVQKEAEKTGSILGVSV